MKSMTPALLKSLAVRTAVAAAAVAACSAASAQTAAFTFNPSAVGLNGSTFTATNLIISDFATITTTATGFTEHGYLNIVNSQNGGATVVPGGLGSTYGLYVEFNATGVGTFDSGSFSQLTYTFYGYNGSGTFSSTSAPTPTVMLGTGTLNAAAPSSYDTSPGGLTSAGANLYFTPSATAAGFFQSPSPFYTMAASSFVNFGGEFVATATGATVTNGGGSINFLATPVPEPETYALLLAGLGAIGFVARRRQSR